MIGYYGPLRSGRAYTLPMGLENVADLVAHPVDFAQLSVLRAVFSALSVVGQDTAAPDRPPWRS